MHNYFIFNYEIKEGPLNLSKTVTTVFVKDDTIVSTVLRAELEDFFQQNLLPDYFLFIAPRDCSAALTTNLINGFEEVFSGIPLHQKSISKDAFTLCTFDKNGTLSKLKKGTLKLADSLFDRIKSHGLQKIFVSRGGLVMAQETHHYVFPSGKHCEQFLRTGNVLIHASEIYFIAFCLLKHFDEEKHANIFCDTSSIIAIAMALCELKNRLLDIRLNVNISSFSSYSGLYKNEHVYNTSDLLLVSASTSGNIVGYIRKQHPLIKEDNIVVLYFLSQNDDYHSIQSRLLCNLTHHEQLNPDGVRPYLTYQEGDCNYCKSGSYAVEISGDVFLLEKPMVRSQLLTINDPEKNLSDFVNEFRTIAQSETILKVNFGESNGDGRTHEIYIDFQRILDGFSQKRFASFKEKLDDYITQYVPANLKYIIYVDDHSSRSLAEYILRNIEANYIEDAKPDLRSIGNLDDIQNVLKSALIVSSCVSYGKKLLYVARALRNSDKLRLVYFVGITRLKDKPTLDFLTKNLKQGKYKSETSTFVSIENLFCFRSTTKTSWTLEAENNEKLMTFIGKLGEGKYSKTVGYLKERVRLINGSGDTDLRGLNDDLFYRSHIEIEGESKLRIRRNFAFFNFNKYHNEVTQSDIYFTISNIINTKRNSPTKEKTLSQSAFVRNLLSPLNFNRFNDGVIQASILRSAFTEELSYIIDFNLSLEMYSILETMVKYKSNPQAEALTEFMYSLAFKKMTLKKIHLESLATLLYDPFEDSLICLLAKYITEETIPDLYPNTKPDFQPLKPF
jgi:hypothetical protein